MKKVLILLALGSLIISPTLWADDGSDDDTTSNSSVETNHERQKSVRQERLKTIKQEREEKKELAKECHDKLEDAATEEEKKTILESCKVKPASGIRKELHETRKENKDAMRDLRKTQRDEMKALRVECKALIEAASDADEATVKADCKTRMKALQATQKAAIEAKKLENYSEMLTTMKSEVEKKLTLIASYSDERKAKLKADLTRRLEKLEAKATEKNDTAALAVVAEIKVLLGQF